VSFNKHVIQVVSKAKLN